MWGTHEGQPGFNNDRQLRAGGLNDHLRVGFDDIRGENRLFPRDFS